MGKLKLYKILSGILMVLAIFFTGSALYAIYLLTGIETFYRIMFSLLLLIALITSVYSLLNSVKFYKSKKFIISSIFTFLLTIIGVIISVLIFSVYLKLSDFNQDDLKYKTSLISLEEQEKLEKLKDLKIGIISDKKDIEGNILPNEVINKYNLNNNNKIVEFSDTMTLMSALVNKEVDLIFISSNYRTMLKNIEGFDVNNQIYEVASYEKKYKKSDVEETPEPSTEKITKPFTILLLGVDNQDEGVNGSFNGDTIMLISFDPDTLHATMFSIPRDTYVPICSAYSKNCGSESKITHSAWSGTQGVINTVESFTGIKVDYYVKINFKGVVDLVNSIGGITVDVPITFCETNSDRMGGPDYDICLNKGVQTLNGEQALALARHRKTLPLGDFQRGQNQQLVVEGMINQIKTLRNVTDFYNILDTISKNIDTSMTTDEMLSFYNIGKSILMKEEDVNINITKTFLTGYDLYIYEGSNYTYTFQYYKQSLNSIINAMKINLGVVEQEPIKNFSFSINSPYEKTIIGYKYYSEPRRTLIPDFTTYSLGGAESWASSHGFTITTNQIESDDDSYYDGQIIGQSVHEGVLLEKSPRTIVLNIVKKVENPNNPEPDPDPNEKPNEEPNEEPSENPVIPGTPSEEDGEENNENPGSDNETE